MAVSLPTNSVHNLRRFDRYFGGMTNYEPLISGFYFTKFILPDSLGKPDNITDDRYYFYNDDILKDFTIEQINNILEMTNYSITPPTISLNNKNVQTQGGNSWSIPTNLEKGNTISVKHLEFINCPISRIYTHWLHQIRNFDTGTTNLKITDRNKTKYGGRLLVFTTTPNLQLQRQVLYTGIYPLKDCTDTMTTDLNAVDKVELNMDFNVDKSYDGFIFKDIWQYATSLIEEFKMDNVFPKFDNNLKQIIKENSLYIDEIIRNTMKDV